MLRKFHTPAVTAVVFLSLITLVFEPFLAAQNSVSTGVVSGRVEDPSGAIIPGADIIISNTANGYKQVSASDKDGLFSFAALPSGAYILAASAAGFGGVRVTDVNATVGQTTTVVVKMAVGEVSQQVQVSASAEVLNTGDSSISSVISHELVENLPSLRRNFTDFALLSPTVTQDGQFGSVSFAGTQGEYTSN